MDQATFWDAAKLQMQRYIPQKDTLLSIAHYGHYVVFGSTIITLATLPDCAQPRIIADDGKADESLLVSLSLSLIVLYN